MTHLRSGVNKKRLEGKSVLFHVRGRDVGHKFDLCEAAQVGKSCASGYFRSVEIFACQQISVLATADAVKFLGPVESVQSPKHAKLKRRQIPLTRPSAKIKSRENNRLHSVVDVGLCQLLCCWRRVDKIEWQPLNFCTIICYRTMYPADESSRSTWQEIEKVYNFHLLHLYMQCY